jgi:hypothetical protein
VTQSPSSPRADKRSGDVDRKDTAVGARKEEFLFEAERIVELRHWPRRLSADDDGRDCERNCGCMQRISEVGGPTNPIYLSHCWTQL